MPAKTGVDLTPGDVMVEDKPLVHIIINECKENICNNCGKRSDQLKKCSKCHQMFYCSRECQSHDWEYHKHECNVFRHDNYNPNDLKPYTRLLLRLYVCVKADQSFGGKCHDMIENSMSTLHDPKGDNFIETFGITGPYQTYNDILRLFKSYGVVIDDTELLFWTSIWVLRRPVLPFYEPKMSRGLIGVSIIGYGVYIQLSNISHSCIPNCAIIYSGLSARVGALTYVPNGTELTVSAIDLTLSPNERQQQLKELSIDCKCLKCEQKIDSNIDYSLFKRMEQLIDLYYNKKDRNVKYELLEIFPKLVSICDTICGKYSPKKTNILLMYSTLLTHIKSKDIELKAKVKEELLDSIRITNGPIDGSVGEYVLRMSGISPEELFPSMLEELDPGHVIVEDQPLVHIMTDEFKENLCNNCTKMGNQLKKCSKCHKMYYCSRQCQSHDWKYHKNECNIFCKDNFDANQLKPHTRLLLRLYLYAKSDETFATKRRELFDGRALYLNSFGRHSETDMKSFEDICEQFRAYGLDFDNKELLHWWRVVSLNRALSPIYMPKMERGLTKAYVIGYGVYIQFSILSHSCIPNCAVIHTGLSAKLRAMKTIPIGEELTVSVIDLSLSPVERQDLLKELSIDCKCLKCEQKIDSNIDYLLFKRMEELMEKYFVQKDRNVKYELLEVFPKLLTFCDTIYGKYSPKKTNILLMYSTLLSHIEMSDNVKSELIPLLEPEIRAAIGVMEGPVIGCISKYMLRLNGISLQILDNYVCDCCQ